MAPKPACEKGTLPKAKEYEGFRGAQPAVGEGPPPAGRGREGAGRQGPRVPPAPTPGPAATGKRDTENVHTVLSKTKSNPEGTGSGRIRHFKRKRKVKHARLSFSPSDASGWTLARPDDRPRTAAPSQACSFQSAVTRGPGRREARKSIFTHTECHHLRIKTAYSRDAS